MRQHGDPNRDYAAEWKKWRKDRGWTKIDLARALFICVRTVYNVESGAHPPGLTCRIRMAKLQKRHREA